MKQSLTTPDFDLMRRLMSEPFNFAYWQSEGGSTTREDAIASIKDALSHRGSLIIEPYEIINRLHWRERADDGSRLVSSLRVQGWAAENAQAEALLLIYQRPDGNYLWTTLVVSRVGLP